MMIEAVDGLETLKLQVAPDAVSGAVEPSTTTVAPTKASAVVASALFDIDTRLASCSFCFICCSTCANCTSCAVNWLVSSGSSGFWFLSCVVSSVRNVVKLPASVPLSTTLPVLDVSSGWSPWRSLE